MSSISLTWSPTLWLNSAHVERWLQEVWPSWRPHDVRSDRDEADRWYWIIPDFDAGRSRILGLPRRLLERTTLSVLRQVLEDGNWRARIEREPLLVERTDDGKWSVKGWDPQPDEQWFPDPSGGHFVAFAEPGIGISASGSARLPQPFLALHGRTWSKMGPQDPRSPRTYTLDELKPYLSPSR